MKLTPAVTGVSRRIFLREDQKEFVDMIRLPDASLNSIYDRNGYMPGAKGANMGKLSKVLAEVVDQTVVGWGGFEDSEGKDIPCTSANKRLLVENTIVGDEGDEESIWVYVSKKFAAIEKEERKN